MAGGLVIQAGGARYGGRITPFVLVACVIAASGGLLFGYDLGISGGVTSMDSFLKEFFPSVLKKKNNAANEGQYCKFDSQLLTLFTSSLYLAALVASFFASSVTRIYGRKASMFIGGLAFFIGSVLNGIAMNVELLIAGRLLLGVGVGFANQSVPLYLCEMAPAKMRGALNIGFNMAVTTGILVAGLINCGTATIKGGWGWRLSLVLAAVPAAIMTIGAFILPDTPNSILERGNPEKARQMLQKVRGMQNVDDEFQDLIDANEDAKRVEHPWKNILQPRYRPQLTFCILIPCFQQLTGINVIMFYAPIIFQTLGFGDDASLMSAVITGSVNMFSTLVSIYSVDKFGRRILFLEGGIQMIFSQIAVGIMIALSFGTNGEGTLTPIHANIILILICSYVASFAWSWGPLGWLIPSEICPLEIRSAGQAINVAVNMLFTFIIAQVFLTMLCHMKFGIFFLFAVFVMIMTVFIYLFLPETRNVSLKEMDLVWKTHWFWSSYIPDDVAFGPTHKR